MREAKQHIADDTFEEWKKEQCEILQRDLQ